MTRLIALWQELVREYAAAFGLSPGDQLRDILLGTFAVAVVALDLIVLAIAGGWL